MGRGCRVAEQKLAQLMEYSSRLKVQLKELLRVMARASDFPYAWLSWLMTKLLVGRRLTPRVSYLKHNSTTTEHSQHRDPSLIRELSLSDNPSTSVCSLNDTHMISVRRLKSGQCTERASTLEIQERRVVRSGGPIASSEYVEPHIGAMRE